MNKLESDFTFEEAFISGPINPGGKKMVFDWDLMVDYFRTNNTPYENVTIGLNGDWKYTSSYAIKDGRICETPSDQMWLSSTHCIPSFSLDGEYGYECWKWEDETEYKTLTFWPKHCVEKLRAIYDNNYSG
jgi:hypothetical protein